MLQSPDRSRYPVLPLRDIVVFPHMIVPLFVGREKSVRALEAVEKDDKQILLVAQKVAAEDAPTPEDIHSVGTVGSVLQMLRLPDGTVKVLVEGNRRARITAYGDNPDFFQAHAELFEDETGEASFEIVAPEEGDGDDADSGDGVAPEDGPATTDGEEGA